MNSTEFYSKLLGCENSRQFEIILDAFVDSHQQEAKWTPMGGESKWNNEGIIGVSADPGRALVERVTNAIDAVLESEHAAHGGLPDCRSPKEAASAWLGVPDKGLSSLTPMQRRNLSKRVQILLEKGEGKDRRIAEIRDFGIGIAPDDMKTTILSLNESNKMQKHYLAGTYGQGGSSTLAVSKFTLIACRHKDSATVGFTIVKYEDLPADAWKMGHYVYLTISGDVLKFDSSELDFEVGTLVRHYGYDLHDYSNPLGPNSVYGLLNEMLFDPVMPIWLDNRILDYRRTIKGSRTALDGAIDAEEESKAPTLSHHIESFYVPMGDYGGFAMQYWVLAPSEKTSTTPIASFVNPKKPIVLTINGQNHAELPISLIKKQAELPYLANRIIVHLDCCHLDPTAKRLLFVTTREDARRGAVRDAIERELVEALKADDDLTRLHTEAYEQVMSQEDESSKQQIRDAVSHLLRLHGIDVASSSGAEPTTGEGDTTTRVSHPRRSRPKPKVLDLREPPTYIRIIWEDDKEILFYATQSRYLRIETDAQSHYHNHLDPHSSRINIMAMGDGLSTEIATTPLNGGRMRAIIKCLSDAKIETKGTIRVELSRTGMPSLSDEHPYMIIKPPEARAARHKTTLPPFRCIPIDPENEMWSTLGWPDDISKVASQAVFANNELQIYFSTVFPRFFDQLTLFERKDTTLANSFTERYKIWIAVHSLFIFEQQQSDGKNREEEQNAELQAEKELWEREERCRNAALAVLFAAKEIKEKTVVSDD